jgi:hypothetical protein
VPTKLKAKIINGDYINLGLLIENVNGADPSDDTKYFSLQDGSIALAPNYYKGQCNKTKLNA